MSRTPGALDKSPTEIDKALTVLAYYGGNAARASQELGIPRSTLTLWRRETHRDRYLEIAEREGPRLEALAASQARETIIRAGEAEHDLLDLLSDRIHEAETPEPQRDNFKSDTLYELAYTAWIKRGSSKELSELAGTVQRISTAKGINGTKLLELTGRPTQVVEHRDPKQAAAALARRLGVVLEGTATDLPALSLLPENASANARDRSISSPPD